MSTLEESTPGPEYQPRTSRVAPDAESLSVDDQLARWLTPYTAHSSPQENNRWPSNTRIHSGILDLALMILGKSHDVAMTLQ